MCNVQNKDIRDPRQLPRLQVASSLKFRPMYIGVTVWTLGWSEKPKSLKSKNGQTDYLPRHSPDVTTVFEI